MSSPSIRHTPSTIYRKARADARDLSVTAVLTAPGVDLAGDVVRPEGLDFARHAAEPWVDLEHAGRCVGWARKSLSQSGGEYGVRWAKLDGVRLPVGTTWFDPHDRLQSQVFALCERDALPGVSLEFLPVPGFMKSLGRSPLEPRDAYEFTRADVVRWTHCARPVNASALTVTKSQAAADPLLSILSAGKIGGEPLHAAIKKSLSHLLPARRLYPVEKAMDEQTPATVYDPELPEAPETEEPDGDEGQPNNGVAALYAKAQSLQQAADDLDDAIQSSDSPELYKLAGKFCDQARSLAEKIKSAADSHDAKLQAMKSGEEPAEEPAEDEEPEEADMATDDDGVFKAIRKSYRPILKALKGRRFTLREVLKGITAAERPADDEAEVAAARAMLEREARKLRRVLARTN